MKEYSFLTENARILTFGPKIGSVSGLKNVGYGLSKSVGSGINKALNWYIGATAAIPLTGTVPVAIFRSIPGSLRPRLMQQLMVGDLRAFKTLLMDLPKAEKRAIEKYMKENGLKNSKELFVFLADSMTNKVTLVKTPHTNLMQGFKTPGVLAAELEQGIADKVADASGKVLNRNPALALAS